LIMNMQPAYTQGNLKKMMFKTALAMLPGTIAMSGYNIVDTYFVGNLGKIPLAAMGFTFPIIMLIICIFRGLGVGIMAIAAQAIGRGSKNKAALLVSSGFLLVISLSIIMLILGLATNVTVLKMLGAQNETLAQSISYMNIWYLGCLTAALPMTGGDLLITVGDSKRAALFQMIGLLVNAALDPVLINGWSIFPSMGIRGAALATVISQVLASVLVITTLSRKHHLLIFEWIAWRKLKTAWSKIIRFAIPSVIGMLLMPIGSIIITWITAKFGDGAVAACAAAGRLEMIAFMIPMSIGMTIIPIVGQNFGAKQYDRIKDCRRYSMRFVGVFLTCSALVYFFASNWIAAQFSPNAEVREIIAMYICIIPWGFGAVEIHRYSGFFFTGCGKPSITAWLNTMRIFGFLVPFSLIALYFNFLTGLFIARLIGDLLSGTIAFYMARRMLKKL